MQLLEYYCKNLKCKTKGVSMDLEKSRCPNPDCNSLIDFFKKIIEKPTLNFKR